ncbi:MAG: TolC family protein [bacterium]|nr:TolC family protein [bacterium]
MQPVANNCIISWTWLRVIFSLQAAWLAGGCATPHQSQQWRGQPENIQHPPKFAETVEKSNADRTDSRFSVLPASHTEGVVTTADPPRLTQREETPDTYLPQPAIKAQPVSSSAQVADHPTSTAEAIPGPPSMFSEASQLAAADTSAPQPVEFFVSLALSGHPKLLAARNRVIAAVNVIPQVSALPDPQVGNTFWPIHDQALQTAGGRVGHQFQLSQGVPWPEKLKAKAAIANREVQIAQAEVDRIEREIAESVQLAYYEVWFANRAIQLIAETRELVNDLTQVAEARYKSGGSQQDVLRARLEADRLDEQLVGLRRQKAQGQADLATLIQQPMDVFPETLPDLGLEQVPQQLDELLALAEECNPELRGLAWEIQRDRQKQRLACLQQYPDFQVGLNYAIINDDNNVLSPVADGHDNINFAFGVSLPIWREKIHAGIREAASRTSSTANRLKAERDAIQGKLRRLIVQADALVEQQDIYNERIIPRTENTLQLSIADYRGKRADFYSLVETYRELLMFETQLARIEATLAGTLAQIQRTVGCP